MEADVLSGDAAGWLQVGAGALIGACVVGALTHSYDVGKPRRAPFFFKTWLLISAFPLCLLQY